MTIIEHFTETNIPIEQIVTNYIKLYFWDIFKNEN